MTYSARIRINLEGLDPVLTADSNLTIEVPVVELQEPLFSNKIIESLLKSGLTMTEIDEAGEACMDHLNDSLLTGLIKRRILREVKA